MLFWLGFTTKWLMPVQLPFPKDAMDCEPHAACTRRPPHGSLVRRVSVADRSLRNSAAAATSFHGSPPGMIRQSGQPL